MQPRLIEPILTKSPCGNSVTPVQLPLYPIYASHLAGIELRHVKEKRWGRNGDRVLAHTSATGIHPSLPSSAPLPKGSSSDWSNTVPLGTLGTYSVSRARDLTGNSFSMPTKLHILRLFK